MANPKHLTKLKEGVEAWNKWRKDNPKIKRDLTEANLEAANFTGARNLEIEQLCQGCWTSIARSNAVMSRIRSWSCSTMVLKLRIKSPTSSRFFAGSNLAESPRAILSVQVNLLRVLGSISMLSHPIHLPPLRDRMEDIPILLNTFVYRLQGLTGKRILGLSKEAIIFESRSPDLFFSFSFWSSLTIWIYIHIFYHKFSIEKFLFSTCQLTPISIKPELAPQQPITLRPFICWFILEDYILYHYSIVVKYYPNWHANFFGSWLDSD